MEPAGMNIRVGSFSPGTGEPQMLQNQVCQSVSGFLQVAMCCSPASHRKLSFGGGERVFLEQYDLSGHAPERRRVENSGGVKNPHDPDHHPLRVESDLGGHQLGEAPDQDAGDHQERQRCGDLADDQQAAKPSPRPGLGRADA